MQDRPAVATQAGNQDWRRLLRRPRRSVQRFPFGRLCTGAHRYSIGPLTMERQIGVAAHVPLAFLKLQEARPDFGGGSINDLGSWLHTLPYCTFFYQAGARPVSQPPTPDLRAAAGDELIVHI